MNQSTTLARTIVRQIVEAGVTDVVISGLGDLSNLSQVANFNNFGAVPFVTPVAATAANTV